MRLRDGAPDAHDHLIDRPRQLMPIAKSPKLTINGMSLDQPARCQHLIDHEDYLRREGDPDRVQKEMTARYLLDELNDRAEYMGRELALARALTLIEIDTKKPGAMDAPVNEWRRDLRELYDVMTDKHAFKSALRMMWFKHHEPDRKELQRVRKNLADAAV